MSFDLLILLDIYVFHISGWTLRSATIPIHILMEQTNQSALAYHSDIGISRWIMEIDEAYMAILFYNTLRPPRQDGRHFADDIFTCIFFDENCCIFINFSLKYVRKGPIDNNPALVLIMAWRRSGDKPLSEPMMISLPMHLCITRPQWVNREYRLGKEWEVH